MNPNTALIQNNTYNKENSLELSIEDILSKFVNVDTTASQLSNNLVHFPKVSAIRSKKWRCNVSKYFRFRKCDSHCLHIKETSSFTQFDIICKLLKSENCSVIYFDENFDYEQIREIRVLQANSRTELVNAKQAYLVSDMNNYQLA